MHMHIHMQMLLCSQGTGTPVVGGLATWQALEIVRGLGDLNLIGMDLVEVSPPFDHGEITAIAAATIAHDWLAVLAEQRKNQTAMGTKATSEVIRIKRSDNAAAYLARSGSL